MHFTGRSSDVVRLHCNYTTIIHAVSNTLQKSVPRYVFNVIINRAFHSGFVVVWDIASHLVYLGSIATHLGLIQRAALNNVKKEGE